MKVLKQGKSADGVDMILEDWHTNYNVPFGSTLAFYPKSKTTHNGSFAPKAGEGYRFSFDFPNHEAADEAFTKLEDGRSKFTDYLDYWSSKPKYKDCI